MPAILLLVMLLGLGGVSAVGAEVPQVGSIAPEFGGTKFYNTTTSDPVTLASLRGKVVLIDFWATWCGPCVAAIPHVSELYEKYKDQGLVVIGHTDATSQNLEQFIKDKPIHYIVSVGASIGDGYGVTGIPHVFLIDPQGKVAWQGHPASLDEQTIVALLKTVHLSPPAAPVFVKPAVVARVAKLEESIASGRVGLGVKTLEKLSVDKDADLAQAAHSSLDVVSAWKDSVDHEISALRDKGDVFGACDLAASTAQCYTGHDAAKEYKSLVAELKKDPQYAAGKEFQKFRQVPPEQQSDPHFAKAIEAFTKKYPEGYYAEQARKLLKDR